MPTPEYWRLANSSAWETSDAVAGFPEFSGEKPDELGAAVGEGKNEGWFVEGALGRMEELPVLGTGLEEWTPATGGLGKLSDGTGGAGGTTVSSGSGT